MKKNWLQEKHSPPINARGSRRCSITSAPAAASTANISRFFFNDTATTEIYTLSLHDALPICYQAPVPATLRAHPCGARHRRLATDRKSTRLNSSHRTISYAVFCLKQKKRWTASLPTHASKTWCSAISRPPGPTGSATGARRPRFFFFKDAATTEICTLSLHDALPIWNREARRPRSAAALSSSPSRSARPAQPRSEGTRLNSSHRTISYAVFCLKK